MTTPTLSPLVCGKTIRLSWSEGPTKGTAQDHDFHEDGTVEWRSALKPGGTKDAVAGKSAAPAAAGHNGKQGAADHAPYSATDVGDAVCLVSYLSRSGYTLTVALNFSDQSTAGIASNEKDWVPVKGRFEVLG